MRISDWSSDVCSSDLNDHYDYQQQYDYRSATASTAHVGLLWFVSHGPTKQRPSSSIRRAVLRARRMVWRLWERTGRQSVAFADSAQSQERRHVPNRIHDS